MLAHDPLELRMAPAFGGSDAYVANLAGGLLLEQGTEMRLPGKEIVDLQEVEPRDSPVAARRVYLSRSCTRGGGPNFIRREQGWRSSKLFESVSDRLLRGAIHR